MSRKTILTIVTLIILGAAAVVYYGHVFEPPAAQLEEYWPTDGWREAQPGDLGLDASRLSNMVDHIERDIPTIDSVMVVRHGYVAVDEYFGSFTEDQRHRVFSCTKSVTSTLVGLAIDEGLIPGLDSKILELLPSYEARNVNDWKTSLAIRHLLPMASGIDARDDYSDNWLWLDRMLEAPDPVQYCLDLNVTVEPGTLFKYTDANSHLMSAIVKEVTGMSALDYARARLFGPLGITDVEWEADPQGVNWGHDRLYMRQRDMAKLGLLFLRGGEWDGQQIVPSAWVSEATTTKIAADLFPGYAYQWWTGDGFYCAMGYAGQFIYVFPGSDMVVVFTGRTMNNWENPGNIIRDYILPSLRN